MTAPPFAGSQCAFETVGDWEALAALGPEWDALWSRSGDAYLVDSFGWADLTWRFPPVDEKRQIFAVIARRQGQLVLVWPFIVRARPFFRIAQPIGTFWGDYSSVLVDWSPGRESLVTEAWRTIARNCPADVIHLPFMRRSSLLRKLLPGAPMQRVQLGSLPAPFVDWGPGATWEDYFQTRSPTHRRDLSRKQRRLEDQGNLIFQTVADAEKATPVIDWMLHHKARWLESSGKEDMTWVRDERFRVFLQQLMIRFGPEERCIIFVLRLNDQIIAADLSSIEDVRVGWYMGTFDNAFRKASPGQVLKQFTLRWALKRNLTFDMRLGEGEHKRFWQTGMEMTETWRLGCSAKGRAYVLGKRAQPLLRQAVERIRPARQAA